jgi:branched-chain amino acid aminotransferase
MVGSQDFVNDARNRDVLALVDGELVPARDATVSIFDAGFGLGDGVWEGLRLHRGALPFLDAHLDRLWDAAAALQIEIGLTRAALVEDLKRLLRANDMTDGAHLRLMVTRGRKRTVNQDPRNSLGRATIVVTAEYKAAAPLAPGGGLSLRTSSIRTTGPEMFDMRLNTHSRVSLIRALLDVIDTGADEAVMLDPRGFVATCNATNLFWVKSGTVHTSGDLYCFNGITRANVIALCRSGTAPLEQGDFPAEALHAADEVFVTGTMGGVTPVREVDGRRLPGAGAPVTARIAAAYRALKDLNAMQNPLA